MDILVCQGFRDYITDAMTMGGPKIVVIVIYNPSLNDRRLRQEYYRNSIVVTTTIESGASDTYRN